MNVPHLIIVLLSASNSCALGPPASPGSCCLCAPVQKAQTGTWIRQFLSRGVQQHEVYCVMPSDSPSSRSCICT